MFALRLKSLRLEKEYTLQQVADYLCVNKTTICFYENGKRFPSYQNIVKLSELFNVSIDYLLGNNSLVKETNEDYTNRELVIKSVYRSKILKDFLLENPDNIKILEDFIKNKS